MRASCWVTLTAVLALATSCTTEAPEPAPIEAELLIQFADDEHPEGIDMAADGTLYVGILSTGEIKAVELDGSERSVAVVNLDGGLMPGLTLSNAGEIFVTVNAPNSAADGHGVLRVSASGEVSLLAEFPAETFPNHITFDDAGDMFVSASAPGAMYRVDGASGEVTLWSDHPRLAGVPVDALDGLVLGANGSVLADDGALLYVSNSSTHEILRLAVEADGSAGVLDCFAGAAADCEVDVSAELAGPDGLAFDVDGRLYIASGLNDAILRVDTDGGVETLWSGRPLEWPTVLVFGVTPETSTQMFVTNIDISRMFGSNSEPYPGVAKFELGVEGL